MQIFVSINEQKLKAVLAENSRAKALYKELEKGDIIINASDYGGFEKSGKLPSPLPRNDEQITMQPCDIILYSGQTCLPPRSEGVSCGLPCLLFSGSLYIRGQW